MRTLQIKSGPFEGKIFVSFDAKREYINVRSYRTDKTEEHFFINGMPHRISLTYWERDGQVSFNTWHGAVWNLRKCVNAPRYFADLYARLQPQIAALMADQTFTGPERRKALESQIIDLTERIDFLRESITTETAKLALLKKQRKLVTN